MQSLYIFYVKDHRVSLKFIIFATSIYPVSLYISKYFS